MIIYQDGCGAPNRDYGCFLMPKINVHGFELGPFATNSYLISSSESPECWIVDPSFEPEELIRAVSERKLRPSLILLTHAHIDHIAGIPDVLRAFGPLPIALHPLEHHWLIDAQANLSAQYGVPFVTVPASRELTDGLILELGQSRWQVLHTPGHSPGGCGLVCAHDSELKLIAGDTLFSGSIGRSDLPGGSMPVLADSIRRRLYTLPEQTLVYPGHGPMTTIGQEKRSNPLVRP